MKKRFPNRSSALILSVLVFLFGGIMACSGDQPDNSESASSPNKTKTMPAPTGKTVVYDCLVEWDMVVKVDSSDAWLMLPDSTVHLPKVRSASGARYETEDYMYWSKGTEAIIEVNNESYGYCNIDKEEATWQDARLRGATFRAAGNEPGWYLEMFPDSTRIILDYGQDTLQIVTPEPTTASPQAEADSLFTFEALGAGNELSVYREPCTLASGKEFSVSVELKIREKEYPYRGCGRFFGKQQMRSR